MRHALVFGASGDIGGAICHELAQQGFSLYLHYYKNQQEAQNLQKSLQIRYPKQDFFVVSLDMTQGTPANLEKFCQEIFALDTLVFAQGNSWYGLTEEMPFEEIRQLWQIHLETPILLLQKLAPKLRQEAFGRIIFIGSIYGEVGSGLEAVYSSVKAAQEGFVKSYAKEVATENITVNLLAPGPVATKLLGDFTAEELQEVKEATPLLRLAEPSEIAYFVGVCAAEKASYLTGSILKVNAGWLGN